MTTTSDVLVIGAGLSGLAAARRLYEHGLDVQVVDAANAPGGRVRTDLVAGFRCDRGFQTVCPAYPAMPREFDVPSLALRRFARGVAVHTGGRTRRMLTDPVHGPGAVFSGTIRPYDAAALAAISARDAVTGAARLKHRPERTTLADMRASGVSPELVERVLRPFLSGVFLERRLETSSRFFHLVWRSFIRGGAAVPAIGMQALPDQLAETMPAGRIEYGASVTSIDADGARTRDGRRFAARAVVIATDGTSAAGLLPGVRAPRWNAVTTYYHATRSVEGPLAEPVLIIDPDHDLIVNTVPISAVAPKYAPPGTSLVATSVLGVRADADTAIQARLREIYQADDWDLITIYPIAHALPTMTAPHPLYRRSRLGDGRYVCGDHRATSSIQGALASGRRVADQVLADR